MNASLKVVSDWRPEHILVRDHDQGVDVCWSSRSRRRRARGDCPETERLGDDPTVKRLVASRLARPAAAAVRCRRPCGPREAHMGAFQPLSRSLRESLPAGPCRSRDAIRRKAWVIIKPSGSLVAGDALSAKSIRIAARIRPLTSLRSFCYFVGARPPTRCADPATRHFRSDEFGAHDWASPDRHPTASSLVHYRFCGAIKI